MILERVRVVVYRLALPPNLSYIHLVFHVLMLHKYILDPSRVLKVQTVVMRDDMTYKVQLKAIVHRQGNLDKRK